MFRRVPLGLPVKGKKFRITAGAQELFLVLMVIVLAVCLTILC